MQALRCLLLNHGFECFTGCGNGRVGAGRQEPHAKGLCAQVGEGGGSIVAAGDSRGEVFNASSLAVQCLSPGIGHALKPT